MKNRYTVRRYAVNKHYWAVFDRLENKYLHSYPDVAKSSAQSSCKYLNKNCNPA